MSHTNATATQVQEILETNLTTSEIDPFLTAAQRFVTDNLEGEGIADATLTEIEKYLGAHFVTLKDPRLRSLNIEGVSETYQRDTQVTEYFKAAAALDPTGQVKANFGDDVPTASFRAGAGYNDNLDLPASS